MDPSRARDLNMPGRKLNLQSVAPPIPAYFYAHKYGAEGYMNDANFSSKHQAEKFKENVELLTKSHKA